LRPAWQQAQDMDGSFIEHFWNRCFLRERWKSRPSHVRKILSLKNSSLMTDLICRRADGRADLAAVKDNNTSSTNSRLVVALKSRLILSHRRRTKEYGSRRGRSGFSSIIRRASELG
jgi:hypothetical protein